jgi:hypothetical protein
MGSTAVASLIAHAAFWGLLLLGFAFDEISGRRLVVFVFLWFGLFLGARWLPYWLTISTCVAILDVALAFQIFKGDVKLS